VIARIFSLLRNASALGLPLAFLLTPLFAQQPPPTQPGTPQQAQQPTEPPPPPLPPPGATLTANQLDGLVAPIALYPDPLVSQILVASTYPKEVTFAVRFLNQHPELKGHDLADAADQQPWDPSVKALLAFPSVLRRLNQDREWTTNLGNAFLAQQADVMQAVQRMRRAAKAAGKLASSRQMTVVESSDSGQTVIEIVPASPTVLYVPTYDPAWIWGPAVWYPYPRWIWGPRPAAGVWFGFGPAIAVGAYFGPAWGGWGGWGGWGWRPGWVNNTVVVNNVFINRTTINNVNTTNVTTTGTTGTSGTASTTGTGATTANTRTTPSTPATSANAAGSKPTPATASNTSPASQTSTWTHDPTHRQGVPYSNPAVAQRFHAPPPGNPRPLAAGQAHPQAHAQTGNRPLNPAGKGKAAPKGPHPPPPKPAGKRGGA